MNPFRRRRAGEQSMKQHDRQQSKDPQQRLIDAVHRRQDDILRRIQLIETEVSVFIRQKTEV